MKLNEALSFTGNEYQKMSYDELVDVIKPMYEAARKRIKRQPFGSAYDKLLKMATGEGLTKKVSTLNVKNGKISISQKFKGNNKMSMGEIRTLRKVLTEFLRDPTSTKRGYAKHKKLVEEQFKAKFVDIDDDDWIDEKTDWDLLAECETESDLIRFGQNRLDWDSDQIYAAIMSCGGYGAMGTNSFNKLLRKYIEEELKNVEKKMEEDIPDFFF